jgi:hypothetical protein
MKQLVCFVVSGLLTSCASQLQMEGLAGFGVHDLRPFNRLCLCLQPA